MKERDRILDSLKGISILGIVLVHSKTSGDLPTIAGQIKAMGATGTIVFMLISVYLMLSSYEKMVMLGNDTYIKWFVSKLLRMAPMYWLFLALRLFLGGYGNQAIIGNAITHFFFINSLFPTFANSLLSVEWFVGALVFFYLITPIMYKVFDDAVKAFCGLLVTSSVALILNHVCVNIFFNSVADEKRYSYEAWIGGWFPPVLLDVYCAAMIWFWVAKKKSIIADISEQTRKRLSFSLMALFAILFVADTIGEFRVWGISSKLISVFTYLLLITALYIHPSKLIVNNVWAFVGKYTYGIFLSHIMIINMIFKIPVCLSNVLLDWIVKYFTSLCGAIIVSVALTELFERPILKLLKISRKNRLTKKNTIV